MKLLSYLSLILLDMSFFPSTPSSSMLVSAINHRTEKELTKELALIAAIDCGDEQKVCCGIGRGGWPGPDPKIFHPAEFYASCKRCKFSVFAKSKWFVCDGPKCKRPAGIFHEKKPRLKIGWKILCLQSNPFSPQAERERVLCFRIWRKFGKKILTNRFPPPKQTIL